MKRYEERYPIELQWQTARNYVVDICRKLRTLSIPEEKRYVGVIILNNQTYYRTVYMFKVIQGDKLIQLTKEDISNISISNKYDKLIYNELELPQGHYTTMSKIRNYLSEKTGKYICYKHDYYLKDEKWYNMNKDTELVIKTKERISLDIKKERVIKSIQVKQKYKNNIIKKYNSLNYMSDKTHNTLTTKVKKYNNELIILNQKLIDINQELINETK